MPLYSFKGYSSEGKRISSIIEADTRIEALSGIRDHSVIPYSIEEVGEKKKRKFRIWGYRKTKTHQIFFEIGIMLKSGLPLVKALDIIIRHREGTVLSRVISNIRKDVTEGMRFSDAIGKHLEIFLDVHISMIRIAESTGRLADVLLNISEYEEKKKEREAKFKQAISYPAIVAVLSSGVVGFLIGYVVPKMESIFHSLKIELPYTTRVLIAFGSFLGSYGLIFVFILGIVIVLLLRTYTSVMVFRKKIDSILINIRMVRDATTARLLELLAFQLKEGLPLTSALSACKGTIRNQVFKEETDRLIHEIEKGRSFSEGLRDSLIFEDMLTAAVRTGESTGNLSEFLERMSVYYRKSLDNISDRVMVLAEPLLILILGLIVGFVVLSIVTPLFNLNQLIR